MSFPRDLRIGIPAVLGGLLIVLRCVQVSQRTLYWDDLVIPAKFSPLSFTGLFRLYDNHLMPGSALVQVLVARAAPLSWWLPALIIVLLTAASFLLWGCALRALAPDRPMMRLIGLALLGFSPFLMDAAGWWSTAINAYAWQCACAGVLWLVLRGHPWFAAIVLLIGLVFTEKSLTIMPVIVVLLLIIGKIRSHKLSILLLVVVTAGWLAVYLPRINFGLGGTTRTVTFGLPTALFQAIIPGAFGGPWQWSRWIPGKAFADPSMALSIIAVIVLFALMFPAALRRPQRVLLLIPTLGYLITIWFFLFTARGGEETSETLLRSMHYYVDWWSMTVLVGVAGLRLHNTTIIKVFTWVFVASSMVSTGTWIVAWHTDPSREYLPNVRAALAREGDTILNQQTPLEVLTPLMHPYNWVSAIAGITPVNATTQPRVFDAHGLLHPARVEPVSHSQLGPEPECGYRVYSGGTVDIPINPGVPFGEWVWEFNSLASTDGMKVTITTPNGLEPIAATNSRAITVPSPTELGTKWVRVPGGGQILRVVVTGPDPQAHVCIGAGALGPLVPVG